MILSRLWVRRIGAVLVAAAFFLPQFSCSVPPPPPGQGRTEPGGEGSAQESERESHYAWEDFCPTSPASWLIIAIFSWPLIVAVRGETARWWHARAIVELAALLYSGQVIYAFASWGRLEIGAYLAMGGFGLYSLAPASELALKTRAVIRSRRDERRNPGRRTMQ